SCALGRRVCCVSRLHPRVCAPARTRRCQLCQLCQLPAATPRLDHSLTMTLQGLAEGQGSTRMSSYADRLTALREQLKAEKLDGFVVPLTDEHMSEYVGSYAQRLAWLTGFEGSAGSAVVLPEEAAIFVDGRYTLQVRQQVSPTEWSYQSVPETSTTQWLEEHAPEGG